jgi:hypothetical protein
LPGFHQGFSRLDFDDSAWPSGQDSPSLDGGFGYEPTGDKQFPGVDIGCPEEGQHYTAYFRCRFTTTEDAEDLELRCRMEDWMQEGIIVYLDGVEVVRDRVEDGADAYHLRAIDSEGFESRYIQRYPISGTLTAGDHVLAISLHSLAPTGYQRSLHIAGITLTASTGEPEE